MDDGMAGQSRARDSEDLDDNRPKKRSKPDDGSFDLLSARKIYAATTPWRGNVAAKLESAAPYNLFLTRVQDVKATYDEDLSISFQELIDPDLGEIEHSLHVNFMVEIHWLFTQYAIVGNTKLSMTVLYGVYDPDFENVPAGFDVRPIHVKMSSPFGHHHTKMSVFFYKDKSVRFAIYTANLIESDWTNRTQGVWVSPRCPPLAEDEEVNCGESETLFKCDIISYLNSYHLPELRPWLQRLQRVDMSSIKVFLVASIPGGHTSENYGYKRLGSLIRKHVDTVPESWKILAQCSSIGSLGPSPTSWLFGDFVRSLKTVKATKPPDVAVIYPTLANVRSSLDGMLGGACLPYSSKTHAKQQWLQQFLMKWMSNGRYRTRAVPHIKTYSQVSPDGQQIAWFLLTSANLSKAAWGNNTKMGIRILSYELGVLFVPQLFGDENVFKIKRNGKFSKDNTFPFPYDSRPTPYSTEDEIFFYDKCFSN